MATAVDMGQHALGAPALGPEQRFVLSNVPWWTYVALRDALGDDGGTRMTYLEGTLELMTPSVDHEDLKTVIGRLVEAWALELDVDLRGFGSTTFRKEAAQRGLEPDECYTIGPLVRGDAPDIAIEVVIASPLLDKLEVHAGLGIPEVWLWRDGSLLVHRLVGSHYESRSASEVLPRLDLALLASFVRPGESQTRLVKDYLRALRGGA